MLGLLKFILTRGILAVISFGLFGVFGALCGFCYLSISDAPVDVVEIVQTDKLAEFLRTPDGSSESFSAGELDGGVLWIMMESARAKGGAVVMPAAPSFLLSDRGVEILIPSGIKIGSLDLHTNIKFIVDEDFLLASTYVGKALIPPFFGRKTANDFLMSYQDCRKYIDAAARIRALAFEDRKVRIEK